MQTSLKSLFKSSHDLILLIGAVIAITIMLSSLLRHWRTVPTSLGMGDAVTVTDSRLASR